MSDEGWKIDPEVKEENSYWFGLARIKTEGERIFYDGTPLPPVPAWRRFLRAVGQRLRYLPARVWWAFFGDDYWDSGW